MIEGEHGQVSSQPLGLKTTEDEGAFATILGEMEGAASFRPVTSGKGGEDEDPIMAIGGMGRMASYMSTSSKKMKDSTTKAPVGQV